MTAATFTVFNSNTALILATLITAGFGYLGVVRQTRKIHDEVKSPNGSTTGQAVELIKEDLAEFRRDQAYLTRQLGEHLTDVEPLEAWVRRQMQGKS